jgi:hypothetical protein
MNLNRFYFTMTLILVTILLTNYVSALEQLDNEGPIYGECKYYTETVIENGVEISKKETRVCDETREIGENPDDVETWTMQDEQKMQMFETGLILFFLFALENM